MDKDWKPAEALLQKPHGSAEVHFSGTQPKVFQWACGCRVVTCDDHRLGVIRLDQEDKKKEGQ